MAEKHEYKGRRRVCGDCGKGRRAAVHLRAFRENSDFIGAARRMVRALGRRAGADIDQLVELAQLRDEVDAQLHRAVGECYAEGYSWADIADRLGVTKQAAHKRFAVAAVEAAERLEAARSSA